MIIFMNPVVHFEMPAEDKKRMMNFYSQAFGWETKMMGADMDNYVLATTVETDEKTGRPKVPGAINGGFYQKSSDPLSQYPSIVISVEDIHVSIAKVKESGGKVHGEIENIPGVGAFVSIIDTEGNRLSLLQPTNASM